MEQHFFNDFPTDITRQILSLTPDIIEQARRITGNLVEHREHDRRVLIDNNIVITKDTYSPFLGFGYAVDGSCILNKKSFGDLVFAAAIKAPFGNIKLDTNADNLINKNHVSVNIVPRNRLNEVFMKSLMTTMELDISTNLNADLIMLDGSFFSYIMSIFNGMKEMKISRDVKSALVDTYQDYIQKIDDKIIHLLENKQYVGFPKYSLSNDLAYLNKKFDLKLKTSMDTDSKSNFSYILEPDEYTLPIKNHANNMDYASQVSVITSSIEKRKYISKLLQNIYTTYYKPWAWSPAIRIDIVGNPSSEKLDFIFDCVKDNTKYQGIFEPYPLFLTDRWAKGISDGASAIIDSSAISCIDDINLKMLFAMSYRT